jgi:predicted nucleic acid-binding protein
MNAVVIDAHLALALILPLPYSQPAAQQFERWKRARMVLHAPDLWSYEVASGLRKAISDRAISPEAAAEGLRSLWALNVAQTPPDPGLALDALRWAERLGRRIACDAVYLALAERLGVEFWTADSALARNLRQMGVAWARSVADG